MTASAEPDMHSDIYDEVKPAYMSATPQEVEVSVSLGCSQMSQLQKEDWPGFQGLKRA